MAKQKFTSEFEIRSSPKLLFPYLNTAGGLSQWYADDVNVDGKHIYTFNIDGEEIHGRMTVQKKNEFIKVEYLYDDKSEMEDPDYTKIALEVNDLTGTTYIVATDYGEDHDSQEDHDELWEGLVDNLKSILGA